MRTLREIAQEAYDIEDEIGLDDDDVLNKLTQEVGEFNDSVQKLRGRYSRKAGNIEDVKGELGDLVLNLISLCHRMGINSDDLPIFAEKTLQKFKDRKEEYKEFSGPDTGVLEGYD